MAGHWVYFTPISDGVATKTHQLVLCFFFCKGKSRAVAKSFASTGSSQNYDGRHGLRRRHLQCLDQCMWKGPAVEKGPGVCGGGCTGQPKLTFGGLVFFLSFKICDQRCFTVLFHAKLVDGCWWDFLTNISWKENCIFIGKSTKKRPDDDRLRHLDNLIPRIHLGKSYVRKVKQSYWMFLMSIHTRIWLFGV